MTYEEQLHSIYEEAKRKGACDLFPHFNGQESVEELAKLMFSPQGREFCIQNRFPSLEVLRTFKQYNPEQYGVYIDCGDIEIENRDCFLVGETRAKVTVTGVTGSDILLMHGADAVVETYGYSVTRIIKDKHSSYIKRQKENSIIID